MNEAQTKLLIEAIESLKKALTALAPTINAATTNGAFAENFKNLENALEAKCPQYSELAVIPDPDASKKRPTSRAKKTNQPNNKNTKS